MIIQSIHYTDKNALESQGKMKSDVWLEFLVFFEKNNIKDVYINSTYRNDKGTHGQGKALDIHKLTHNNKTIDFTVRSNTYSKQKDIEFFNFCRLNLKDKLLQYISPAIIYLPKAKTKLRFNKYINDSKSTQFNILDNLKTTYKGDMDAQHLHHLHISLEPNGIGNNAYLNTLKKNYFPMVLFGLTIGAIIYLKFTKKGQTQWYSLKKTVRKNLA